MGFEPISRKSRFALQQRFTIKLLPRMAGALGFEPKMRESKSRALTTWLRPYLGYHPISLHILLLQ